jgi:tetratricopeptide (TPR) repeat protein
MFKHKLKLTAAAARALLVGTLIAGCAGLLLPGGALAETKEKETPSAKLVKPLHEAQELLKARKFSDAILKLKEAQEIGGKTPFDQHIINDFLGNAYVNTQNYGEAAKAYEAEIDDGYTAESEKPQKTRAITDMYYAVKNYDKAIEFGTRAIKAGYADERIRTLVAQANYLKADYKNTIKVLDGWIESQIKAGESPKKDSLLLVYSACQKLNDSACQTRALEKLVQYHPQPDYWKQLLYSLRQETSGSEASLLQTYRLMLEVDVLQNAEDYTEMAQLALEAGSPGEAQRILEKGIAKGVFSDPRSKQKNERLLESAKKAAATDQQSLPGIAKEADAAPNGTKNVKLGLAYLGYGQYEKAVETISKGIAKGGLRNENEARLLLGIAELKAGHKDDATKAFRAVKGDPSLERLANLWTLHARQA